MIPWMALLWLPWTVHITPNSAQERHERYLEQNKHTHTHTMCV